jgi:hypothetical protein
MGQVSSRIHLQDLPLSLLLSARRPKEK